MKCQLFNLNHQQRIDAHQINFQIIYTFRSIHHQPTIETASTEHQSQSHQSLNHHRVSIANHRNQIVRHRKMLHPTIERRR